MNRGEWLKTSVRVNGQTKLIKELTRRELQCYVVELCNFCGEKDLMLNVYEDIVESALRVTGIHELQHEFIHAAAQLLQLRELSPFILEDLPPSLRKEWLKLKGR